MKINVLLYAEAREIAGKGQIDMEIPAGASVADLLGKLYLQYPTLAKIIVIVAVNTEYVESGYLLHDGDKVAIIPPINGG